MSLIPTFLRRSRAKPDEGRAPHAHAHGGAAAERVRAPLTQFRDDPIGFIAHALPNAGKPYPKQVEMLNLVAKERRVSVVGCNGAGKDWVEARVILWWLETRPQAKVVVIAPTQRQIERILWPEIASAIANADIPLSGKLTQSRYEISHDRFAIAFSTNKPERLQGFHSPELLLIVDEAHGVEQPFMDAALRLNASKTLMAGNALPRPGEFFDSHHSKQASYARLKITADDTPNVQEGAENVPGLITPEDIAEKAEIWGADHPLFRSAVYAEFPDAEDNSLVGRKAVEDAMADDAPSGEGAPTESDDEREPVYVGVDVARFGEDKSVLIARRGQRVVATKSLGRDMDTMRVAGEAAMMARDLAAEAIFVDENGVGGGVCDRLKEVGAPVYGVQFGRRAPHPTRFANLRSEIFWELRRLMNDRLIALPNDEELAAQLLSLRYEVSSSGQVVLESKRMTRKRGIPSPDRADALALAFMRPPSLQIWTGYEPFLRPRAPAGLPLPPPIRDDDAPPGGGDDGDGDTSPNGAGNGNGADGNMYRHSRVGGNLAPNGVPYGADGGHATDAAAHNNRHSRVGRNPEGAGATPVPNGAAHNNRHSRVGGNPAPNGAVHDYDGHAPDAAAHNARHSGVGRNPEGAGVPPAPPDPADVPLDRFFIRF